MPQDELPPPRDGEPDADAADRKPASEPAEEEESVARTFALPRREWVCPLLCLAVAMGWTMALAWPLLSARGAPGAVLTALLMTLAVPFLLLADWPRRLFAGHRGIRLDEEGIQRGGNELAWNNLARVRPAHWLWGGRAHVILEAAEGSFWSLRGGSLTLPGNAFVFREVLPAVRAVRPEAEIHPALLAALEAPEAAARPPKRLTAALLLAVLGALVLLLHPARHGISGGSDILVPGGFFLLCALVQPHLEPRATRAEELLPVAALGSLHLGVVFLLALLIAGGSPALWLFVAVWLALTTAALAVTLFPVRLTRPRQAALVLGLLAVPLLGRAATRHATLPWEPLPPTLQTSLITTPLWSPEGRYVTDWLGSEEGAPAPVLDLRTGAATRLDSPTVKSSVAVWLDGKALFTREVPDEDAPPSVELVRYDLDSGRRRVLSRAARLAASLRYPVSPDGTRLAWLEQGAEGEAWTVRIATLSPEAEPQTVGTLPREGEWSAAHWRGPQLLQAEGYRPAGERRRRGARSTPLRHLQLHTIDLRTGAAQSWASRKAYAEWQLLVRRQRAFVREPGPQYKYLELPGEEVLVDFQTAPQPAWPTADERYAFHLDKQPAGTALVRFDLETTGTELLAMVPADYRLAGVSADGRYASFALPYRLGAATWRILDLQTGRRHWLALPGLVLGDLLAADGTDPVHWRCRAFRPGPVPGILQTIGQPAPRNLLADLPDADE